MAHWRSPRSSNLVHLNWKTWKERIWNDRGMPTTWKSTSFNKLNKGHMVIHHQLGFISQLSTRLGFCQHQLEFISQLSTCLGLCQVFRVIISSSLHQCSIFLFQSLIFKVKCPFFRISMFSFPYQGKLYQYSIFRFQFSVQFSMLYVQFFVLPR